MNQSRRVLLILSNNFAKSKWCEFQMHFSYNRCLEEKRNNVIVAVLTEISYKYLSNTLKALLTTHDYALWSKSDETGQNLFWEKILRKLQFQSNPTESADGIIGDIQ
jgi:toll-like receptor 13